MIGRPRVTPRDEAHARKLEAWRRKRALDKPKRDALRAERRARGLCLDCGKAPVPDRVRCDYHLELKANEKIRARARARETR